MPAASSSKRATVNIPAASSSIWASINSVMRTAPEAVAQASRASKVMENYTPHTTTATPLPIYLALAVHATNTTMLNCSTLIGEDRIACFSLLNETTTTGLLWDDIDGGWLEFWVYIGNYVVFLVVYILPVLVGCIYALSVGYVRATAIFGKRISKRSAGGSNDYAAENVGGQMDWSAEGCHHTGLRVIRHFRNVITPLEAHVFGKTTVVPLA
ncbi:hypothetical protein LTR17_004591 [Elasticomyces elasticus]|nr:hypothetical protein LTR17_004591 [Elasticomyces elasticus]